MRDDQVICPVCARSFASAAALRAHRREGHACEASLAERLQAKVDASGGPDACHPWTGVRATNGYGHTSVRTRPRGAHRVALELKLGRPLRPGYFACHTCDNPPCVNPAHLWEATNSENLLDMVAKGRSPSHSAPKLSAADVHEIHDRMADGESMRALARAYGVAQTTIKRAVTRGRLGART